MDKPFQAGSELWASQNNFPRLSLRLYPLWGAIFGLFAVLFSIPSFATDTTPPVKPTGLAASGITETEIDLAWNATTDNVGVTGYHIERCTGTSCTTFAEIAITAGITDNDTGLNAATTYRYRIRASDAAGNLSAYSTIISVKTVDLTSPDEPTNLVATAASGTNVTLTWSATTDNVGVTGYLIEQCAGDGCSNFSQIATTTTALTYSNTGLTMATSYSYRIRAKDAAGNLSDYSIIATATTPDTTAPVKPTGLTASVISTTELDLAWNATTDNVGVTGYHIERCMGAGCTSFAEIAVTTDLTYKDAGLYSGTVYQYRIRASDAAGNLSAYSTIATATTKPIDNQPPTIPSNFIATATSSTQVNVSWHASTDNIGVTGYLLERCQGAGCSSFIQIAQLSPTTSYSDTGLSPSTTYSYRIRAEDDAGNYSDYSSMASTITQASPLDTVPPIVPSGITATATLSTQISLSWSASSDNVDVTGYLVERCEGTDCADFTQIATPTSATFNDVGLAPSTVYVYRVRATDAANNLSDYSSTASATTLSASYVSHTHTYSYDQLGRITQVVESDGTTIDYTYDDNGNITSVEHH